jgi:uroporphyrinogen decarboxylase
MHCCGAIRPILPRLIELGMDLLHPIQALAAGMDAESLREFKGQVTFVGGIDTQQLLRFATPDDVEREVRRVVRALGPLVVSPSHEALLPDIPPENVAAMARAAKEAYRGAGNAAALTGVGAHQRRSNKPDAGGSH